MKYLLLILSVMILTGCNPASNDQTAANNKESEKAIEEFSKITGFYTGSVHSQKLGKIEIELFVYYTEVANGRDSEGRTRFFPVLKAQYNLPTWDPYPKNLEASFTQESGDLTLTSTVVNKEGKEAPAARSVYIKAVGSNRSGIEGNVTIEDPLYNFISGKLQLKYQSKDNQNTDLRNRDRSEYLRKILKKSAGTYAAIVTPEFNADPFRVYLRLSVAEVQVGTDYIPVLVGYYNRLPETSKPVRLTVNYRPETGQISFDSSSTEGVIFNGFLDNNDGITGTVVYPRFQGRLIGNKID